MNENNAWLLCIPDGNIENFSIRETVISHTHSLLAHLGNQKTYHYLRDNTWWPGMYHDIVEYCKSCHTCMTSKLNNQKLMGKLKPLPVPYRGWEQVGIDFIGPLPGSKNQDGEFDMICIIIDHLTSMVHLVPSKSKYWAKDIAELVFENVYQLHGLLARIVSNRDSLFTGGFCEHLHKLTKTELRMSTVYHLQMDGTTEWTHRTVGQMLWITVAPDQKDWVQKLSAIEFALNTTLSDVSGYSLFFLNYRGQLRLMLWDLTGDTLPGVRSFMWKLQDGLMYMM